jgi:hypothetical protein
MVLLLAAPAAPHSFIAKAFDDLVSEADHILVGIVTGNESRWVTSGAIVTDIHLSVLRDLKGGVRGSISLLVLGGTVGDTTLEVAGFPAFPVGQTYVLFVKDNGTTILPLVGGNQGVFRVLKDFGDGKQYVANEYGEPILAPSVHAAVGTHAGQAIELNRFVTTIRNHLGGLNAATPP